jgi:hypothetical protein
VRRAEGEKRPMGRKLGNALIIYGVVNFLASFPLGNPIIVLGALVWMIILMRLDDKEREKLR